MHAYFNPRSPSRERRASVLDWLEDSLKISIHALRAESDKKQKNTERLGKKFQSTLSEQRATVASLVVLPVRAISIHALRAESDKKQKNTERLGKKFQSTLSEQRATDNKIVILKRLEISIHALRAESDEILAHTNTQNQISIHALRAESDIHSYLGFPRRRYFNPRSPSRERLKIVYLVVIRF